MRRILILKLGAAGDVVRTTPLLTALGGEVHWIVDDRNAVLLEGIAAVQRWIPWSARRLALDRDYDLVINLEDSPAAAALVAEIRHSRLFGAYRDAQNHLTYTDTAAGWFDLSLISRLGIAQANTLKLLNRKSYQDLIFEGLGLSFRGEPYLLPRAGRSPLDGDVAVAPRAGAVWPMKNWAYFDDLIVRLRGEGLKVNVLPLRNTLVEHLADVHSHRCLVSGDSLPMHLALGCGVPCVTLFICTSPWEIFDYRLQHKVVSPLLAKYFYKRTFEPAAVESIAVDTVVARVQACLEGVGL